MIVFIYLNFYKCLTFLFNKKGVKPKKRYLPFCIAVSSPPQPPVTHQPSLPAPLTLWAAPIPSEEEWVKAATLTSGCDKEET